MKKVYALLIIALMIFSCSNYRKEIIGKWINNSKYGVATITMYQKGDAFYLENSYQGKITGTKELTTKEVEKQLRYVEKDGGDLANYYVIDDQKSLRIYNDQGIINTCRKTKY
ncbi:MAG: hypothetical protein JKX73_04710 [Flavobacteriales bacterium]|nr:hypothetical protein [Flavobacteriales bacterium]